MTGADGSPDDRSIGDVAPPPSFFEKVTEGLGKGSEQLRVGAGGVFAEGRGGDGGNVTAEVGRGPGQGGRPVVALVLGNEVTGVDERVLKICDVVIEVSCLLLRTAFFVCLSWRVCLSSS